MRGGWAVLTLGLWLGLSTPAKADLFGQRAKDTPSVFGYAYRGLLAGSMVGLGGGYLAARRHGFDSDDWKPMVYGVGFGALSGMALGLTLGVVEIRDRSQDRANLALRDAVSAGALGTLTGAIVGGLVTIKTHDAEHVLFGASIGTLSGVGVGLIVGLVQGRIESKKARARSPKEAKPPEVSLRPSMQATQDAGRQQVWLLGASGRF